MRAFVIAMDREADAVRPALAADDRLYVAGIGKVNAAAATQRAIDDFLREGGAPGDLAICNVGVAGGFAADMEVGDVYAIESAVEYDFDLAAVNGTAVGQLNERDSPFIPLSVPAALPPLVKGRRILATGDRFNDSDADLELLRRLGATVRDMEGAAIAHVCERNRVKCVALKCISDVHGRGRMTRQFQDNLESALGRLAAVCARWR